MEFDLDNPICIVQRQSDGSFAYSHEGEIIELGTVLPSAVNALDERGIHATHWLPKGDNARMSLIPTGVARHHLTEEQIEEIRDVSAKFMRLDRRMSGGFPDRAMHPSETIYIVDAEGRTHELAGGASNTFEDGYTYRVSYDGSTIHQISEAGFVDGEFTAHASLESIAEALGETPSTMRP